MNAYSLYLNNTRLLDQMISPYYRRRQYAAANIDVEVQPRTRGVVIFPGASFAAGFHQTSELEDTSASVSQVHAEPRLTLLS